MINNDSSFNDIVQVLVSSSNSSVLLVPNTTAHFSSVGRSSGQAATREEDETLPKRKPVRKLYVQVTTF